MSLFDRLTEEKIRAAQAAGQFDGLRGAGQPLNLNENPFEDPAARDLNRLVKEHGFRPDWLELDVDLRQRVEKALHALRRTWQWHQATPTAQSQAEWARAQTACRTELANINRQIFLLNLKVPLEQLQRRPLDIEAEIQRAQT